MAFYTKSDLSNLDTSRYNFGLKYSGDNPFPTTWDLIDCGYANPLASSSYSYLTETGANDFIDKSTSISTNVAYPKAVEYSKSPLATSKLYPSGFGSSYGVTEKDGFFNIELDSGYVSLVASTGASSFDNPFSKDVLYGLAAINALPSASGPANSVDTSILSLTFTDIIGSKEARVVLHGTKYQLGVIISGGSGSTNNDTYKIKNYDTQTVVSISNINLYYAFVNVSTCTITAIVTRKDFRRMWVVPTEYPILQIGGVGIGSSINIASGNTTAYNLLNSTDDYRFIGAGGGLITNGTLDYYHRSTNSGCTGEIWFNSPTGYSDGAMLAVTSIINMVASSGVYGGIRFSNTSLRDGSQYVILYYTDNQYPTDKGNKEEAEVCLYTPNIREANGSGPYGLYATVLTDYGQRQKIAIVASYNKSLDSFQFTQGATERGTIKANIDFTKPYYLRISIGSASGGLNYTVYFSLYNYEHTLVQTVSLPGPNTSPYLESIIIANGYYNTMPELEMITTSFDCDPTQVTLGVRTFHQIGSTTGNYSYPSHTYIGYGSTGNATLYHNNKSDILSSQGFPYNADSNIKGNTFEAGTPAVINFPYNYYLYVGQYDRAEEAEVYRAQYGTYVLPLGINTNKPSLIGVLGFRWNTTTARSPGDSYLMVSVGRYNLGSTGINGGVNIYYTINRGYDTLIGQIPLTTSTTLRDSGSPDTVGISLCTEFIVTNNTIKIKVYDHFGNQLIDETDGTITLKDLSSSTEDIVYGCIEVPSTHPFYLFNAGSYSHIDTSRSIIRYVNVSHSNLYMNELTIT